MGMRPEEVVMTAAHQNDLLSAQKVGLRAAFVAPAYGAGARTHPGPHARPLV